MKRIISILLAASFLISTTGFSLVTHYCMGRLINSSVFVSDNYHPCGCNGAMPDGCCRNDVSFIKIKDDFQTSFRQTNEFFPAVIQIFYSFSFFLSSPESYLKIKYEYPPPWIIEDISVFLCTFKI